MLERRRLPRSIFSSCAVTLLTLALCARALAQDPAPYLDERVVKQMATINSWPSCDDPPLRTDADAASCGTTGEAHVLDAASELGDYNDTGDPVALHNGAVSFRAVDMVIPGRCMDFELTRRYYSKRSEQDGPLGYGWTFSYDVWLQFSGTSEQGGAQTVVLWNGNCRQDAYVFDDIADEYTSPLGLFTHLEYFPATSKYTLRARHGSVSTFTTLGTSYGRLEKIESRNENTLTFQYYGSGSTVDGRSRLQKVVDTMGRGIVFAWNGGNRLSRVTDFAGREINYAYDSSGNLINARSPKVLFASDEHLAPVGRIERYRYYGGSDGQLKHLLTEVVRPNQGQNNANGQAAAVFTYSTSGWRKGWCSSQRLGNAAGTQGGIITYNYVAQNASSAPADPTVDRIKTTVTDRRGHTTEYWINEYGHCTRIVENYTQGSQPMQAVTDILYDNTLGESEGLIKEIIYPRDNSKSYTYSSSSNRWQQGNVATETHTDPTGPMRTIQYTWDPVFNHLLSVTDERGNVTQFKSDWMEGDDDPLDASTYILDDIAVELDITEIAAGSLVSALLTDSDLNGDGQRAVLHGNLVQRNEPPATLSTLGNGNGQALAEGNATQESVTTWTYNKYGQRTSMTNAEENVTLFYYFTTGDPDGDGTSNSNSTDPTGGYLNRVVEDAALPAMLKYGGLDANNDPVFCTIAARAVSSDIGRQSGSNGPTPTAKTTDFLYKPFGPVSAVIDARGVRTDYFRNDVGETYYIVRAASVAAVSSRLGGADPNVPENLSGQDYAYAELICHDFNGNETERRIRNLGNDGDIGYLSGWIESYLEYDILDNLTSESHEATSDGEFATTEYGYDENENLISVIKPEGNEDHFEYDELDHPTRTTLGAGSAVESIVERLYDENGNVVSVTDGDGHETTFTYDGFDRLRIKTEPTATETAYTYDLSSNVTDITVHGWDRGPSQGTPSWVQLSQTTASYDSRSRPWRVNRHGTNLVDGAIEAGNNQVTTRLDYDRLGRRTFVVEDDAEIYEVRFDGANRPVRSIDPAGNEVTAAYDDNNNPVLVVEKEQYPNATNKTFDTFRIFDSLNRLMSVTDNVGQTSRFEYDSRDNLTLGTDPQATLTSQTINGRTVNGPGNSRHYFHDALGRLVREQLDLRVGGTGNGIIETTNLFNTDGKVILKNEWDLNGRLVTRIDDAGNETAYEYDAIDRRTAEELADASRHEYQYNLDHTLAQAIDPNGTVVTFDYDSGSRLTIVDAVTPAYVIGTKHLRFDYDGLGRRTYSRDSVDGAVDSNDWAVTRSYDELDRVLTENQGGRTVSYAWHEESKRNRITYPSGLVIDTSFDELDRVSSIFQGAATLALYTYAGPGRVLERVNGNTTKVRYHNGSWDDSLYWDGARRPTRVDHVTNGGTLLTGFAHGYDRLRNRLYEKRLHDGSKGDNYVYDSLYRIVTFERRVPAVDVGMPGQGNEEQLRAWALDGVQNWRQLVIDGTPTSTSVNSLNEYIAFGAIAPEHDDNGNLQVVDGNAADPVVLSYDFLNRLRRMRTSTTPQKIVSLDYDAEGRRVRTAATSTLTDLPATSYFVYDDWEELEEWNASAGSGTLLRRYVHGRELDEVLRVENLSFYAGTGTYWLQQTTLGSVAAIANSAGAVVERYTYDVYGSPNFEEPNGSPKSVSRSDFGNAYLFQSRRFDSTLVSLYDFRTRQYDPLQGRFLQRDTAGNWTDGQNLGNSFTFVWNDPVNVVDPYGLHGDPRAAFFDFVHKLQELDKCLDEFQEWVGLAGLIPGAGAAPDLGNAVISAGRGNFGQAGASVFFAIPIFGDLASLHKIKKFLDKFGKNQKRLKRARDAAKRLAERIAKQGRHDRSLKSLKEKLAKEGKDLSHDARKELEAQVRELEGEVAGHHKAIDQAENNLATELGDAEAARDVRNVMQDNKLVLGG